MNVYVSNTGGWVGGNPSDEGGSSKTTNQLMLRKLGLKLNLAQCGEPGKVIVFELSDESGLP